MIVQIKCIKTGYIREFRMKEINFETNTLTVFDDSLSAIAFLNNGDLIIEFGKQNKSTLIVDFTSSEKITEFLRVVDFRIL